jgi:hypothetical protein
MFSSTVCGLNLQHLSLDAHSPCYAKCGPKAPSYGVIAIQPAELPPISDFVPSILFFIKVYIMLFFLLHNYYNLKKQNGVEINLNLLGYYTFSLER